MPCNSKNFVSQFQPVMVGMTEQSSLFYGGQEVENENKEEGTRVFLPDCLL